MLCRAISNDDNYTYVQKCHTDYVFFMLFCYKTRKKRLFIFLPVYIEDTGIYCFKIYVLENTESSKLAYGKLKTNLSEPHIYIF